MTIHQNTSLTPEHIRTVMTTNPRPRRNPRYTVAAIGIITIATALLLLLAR